MNPDRVYLVEIGGAENVAATIYATLDQNNMTAPAELELSGLQLTNDSTGLAQSRSTLALSSGRFYIEALFHGNDGLGNDCRIGLGGPLASVATLIGTAADSVAFRPDNGGVYSGGALIDTLTPAARDDIIGFAIDLDASPPAMDVSINGAVIGSVALASGVTFHVYAALSAIEFAGLHAFVNFGQRGTEYDAPSGFSEGWFTAPATPPPLQFATASITFPNGDVDKPDAHYSGRIAESFRMTVRREVVLWVNGRSGGSRPGFGTIPIIDPRGDFASLLQTDYRDQIVRVLSIKRGQAYSEAQVVWVAVIDRVEADGMTTTIHQKDRQARLDVALQRRLFLPNVADSAANQPRPILLGTARNFEPIIFDELNLGYAINDSAVQTIVVVRDRADPLEPDASPADWTYNDTSTGLYLNSEPFGKLTVDASTTGGSGVPVFVDVLGGIGDPFTGGSDVTGFAEGEGTFSGEPYGAEVVSGRLRLFHGDSGPSGNTAWVSPEMSPTLGNGGLYRARLVVSEFSYHAGNRGGSLFVRGAATGITYATITAPGTYAFTFTAGSDEIYLSFNQIVAGGDTADRQVFVDSFTVEDVTSSIITDYDAPIPGITLRAFAEEIIERRGGLSPADWSSASAEAIDDGYDCGIFVAQQITARQALDQIIDSYGGAWWQARPGDIRFGRIEGPEVLASPDPLVFAFNDDNIVGRPSVEIDIATGLSNRMACRRNWDPFGPSDFVDDAVDVPLALRERFKREYQFVRVSSANLVDTYRHAILQAPINSLIDDPEDAQVEIDRVCALFTQLRYFVSWSVAITDADEFTVEPFDIVSITFPDIPLLAGGVRVQVRLVEFNGNTVSYRGWF